MSVSRDSPARGRRLPSIFDHLPPGVPVSLRDLETLMEADTQMRLLAVLDRVLPRRNAPQVPEPAVPE